MESDSPPGLIRKTSDGRRYFSAEHKAAIVAEYLRSDKSVSAIASAHGFNASVVRKWIREHQREAGTSASTGLVAVSVTPPTAESGGQRLGAPGSPNGCIEIEVNGLKLVVRGEVNAVQLRTVLEVVRRSA